MDNSPNKLESVRVMRNPDGTVKAGSVLNPIGRPKRKTLTELIHAKLDASIEENWDALADLVIAKIFKQKDKEILMHLWDRTEGKPKQIVELDDTTEKISRMKEYVDNKIQSMDGAVPQEPTGEKFIMTEGQTKIFEYIYDPSYRRVSIRTTTQYGKSDVTSMAIIHSMIDRKEKILIVSPSIKQSEIIMGYIIDHLFDNKDIESMLDVAEPLERLKRERSKQRITFRTGSEVAILTADARTVSQEAKGLMGFGASTVIIDESALIPDEMFGKIFRMVGGTHGKIVQLGNPFPSKHFESTFSDENYTTLTIDYKQSIAEGRLTKEYVEEARRTITSFDFSVFYECEFPRNEGDVFKGIDTILTATPHKPNKDHLYVMGVDLARVTDYTVIVVYDRMTNAQVYQSRFNDLDWVVQRDKIRSISKLYNDATVSLDATGLGDPIAEDLIRRGVPVSPVRISAPIKTELIEKLSIAIEQNMIRMINLPETKTELEKFTYSKTGSGYIKYEARPGYHDDIVMAHALAVRELSDKLQVEVDQEEPPVRKHYLESIRRLREDTIESEW